jgi:hypothetical protein
MAEQVLALVKYLTSTDSPLATMKDRNNADKSAVYFSLLGRIFIMYSSSTANAIAIALLTSATLLAIALVPNLTFDSFLRGSYAVISAAIAGIISANFVAFFMTGALNKPLSWFSNELAPILLYAPPALAGKLCRAAL